MKPIYKIGLIDITSLVLVGKLNWERNDIDDSDSGRTLDGEMHRKRITSKRKMSVTCKRMTTDQIQALCAALAPEYVDVTYLDPELGVVTKTFYSSQLTSAVWGCVGETTYWDNAQFSLIEK